MTPEMWWAIVSPAIALLAGWAMGYRHGRSDGVRDGLSRLDRMLRIDPPGRTEGLPTNLDAEPSIPRRPRWRAGSFSSGPPHRR